MDSKIETKEFLLTELLPANGSQNNGVQNGVGKQQQNGGSNVIVQIENQNGVSTTKSLLKDTKTDKKNSDKKMLKKGNFRRKIFLILLS